MTPQLAHKLALLLDTPTPVDFTERVLATLDKIPPEETEPCPFCEEGHHPDNKWARCEFCKGTTRLRKGEAMEIAEKIWEESR